MTGDANEYWTLFRAQWISRAVSVGFVAVTCVIFLLAVALGRAVYGYVAAPVQSVVRADTSTTKPVSTLLELQDNPTAKEQHAAAVFMAKRCRAELAIMTTHADSVKVYQSEKTFSATWPDPLAVLPCIRWIVLSKEQP
jgi:hypothetical protein